MGDCPGFFVLLFLSCDDLREPTVARRRRHRFRSRQRTGFPTRGRRDRVSVPGETFLTLLLLPASLLPRFAAQRKKVKKVFRGTFWHLFFSFWVHHANCRSQLSSEVHQKPAALSACAQRLQQLDSGDRTQVVGHHLAHVSHRAVAIGRRQFLGTVLDHRAKAEAIGDLRRVPRTHFHTC